MTDNELLDMLNEVIETEDGKAIGIDSFLIDSGVDSFGFTMVLVTMDDKFGIWTQEEMETMDMKTITARIIIDRIKETL